MTTNLNANNKPQCHAVLSVSLANTAFRRRFTSNLYTWALKNNISKIDIIIGDHLESINYRAFRELDEAKANSISSKRGIDIESMFINASPTRDLSVHIIKTSDYIKTPGSSYKHIFKLVHNAHDNDISFRNSVHDQVFENLSARIFKHGISYVESKYDILKEYLLDEISILESYYIDNGHYTEIYPGDIMSVRIQIWNGCFSMLSKLSRENKNRSFLNVEDLSNNLADVTALGEQAL